MYSQFAVEASYLADHVHLLSAEIKQLEEKINRLENELPADRDSDVVETLH